MRKLILIFAAVALTGCALYPRTGTDFLSRRRAAQNYAKAAEQYGWHAPGDEPKIVWNAPTSPDQCLLTGRMIEKRYSLNPEIRWLQKRHLWPVRKIESVTFTLIGRCAQ